MNEILIGLIGKYVQYKACEGFRETMLVNGYVMYNGDLFAVELDCAMEIDIAVPVNDLIIE